MSQDITIDEYLAELEKMQANKLAQKQILLTEEQYQVIDKARAKGITWTVIYEWWLKQGYDEIAETSMQSRYMTEKARRGRE